MDAVYGSHSRLKIGYRRDKVSMPEVVKDAMAVDQVYSFVLVIHPDNGLHGIAFAERNDFSALGALEIMTSFDWMGCHPVLLSFREMTGMDHRYGSDDIVTLPNGDAYRLQDILSWFDVAVRPDMMTTDIVGRWKFVDQQQIDYATGNYDVQTESISR